MSSSCYRESFSYSTPLPPHVCTDAERQSYKENLANPNPDVTPKLWLNIFVIVKVSHSTPFPPHVYTDAECQSYKENLAYPSHGVTPKLWLNIPDPTALRPRTASGAPPPTSKRTWRASDVICAGEPEDSATWYPVVKVSQWRVPGSLREQVSVAILLPAGVSKASGAVGSVGQTYWFSESFVNDRAGYSRTLRPHGYAQVAAMEDTTNRLRRSADSLGTKTPFRLEATIPLPVPWRRRSAALII